MGVMMVNSTVAAAANELGIVYNLSAINAGNKNIMYPDSLAIDGSYNL